MTLPSLPRLKHELRIGYDFKTSNNNLDFEGFSVFNVTSQVDQFALVYNANETDDFEYTIIGNSFVFSPGHLSPQNSDPVFEVQADSPFAKSSYICDRLELTRLTRLPDDVIWVMHLVGQDSDENLVASEQLHAGESDFGRGYDENTANGTFCVLLSKELRSPPFSPIKKLLDFDIDDQAQAIAFWHYASVRDKNLQPGESGTELSSVGLGLRFKIGRYLDSRLDYGWQLHRLPGPITHNQLAQFSVTLSY